MAKRTEEKWVKLQCTVCKEITTRVHKNKKKLTERMEMEKFCRFCKKHTTHKETK